MRIPKEILEQHVAVLGKTGSGKTSTAKLLIEHVVAEGARVCILDPIKSDWWGLISSADGRRPGLPFHILGGPRGHVPLHSSAGKAVAEIVANGALPLSIIDMADFEPGGQARFFVDFAPTLLRKMRGVVYLVIEEAHLFAPKERSGIGSENLSIHWAKTLATAGRSKGVRLVLVTQRTQALHNALLGSCDTMIVHRLTAPADQEPPIKWLKANTTKSVMEQVAASLASLKTGDAWICSGEAKHFASVHFPRISTYDNTATPTGDTDVRDVKTAPVDHDKLRAIIGQAIDQAKADDPRELRKRIAELERQLKSQIPNPKPQAAPPPTVIDKPVVTDDQLARIDKQLERLDAVVGKAGELLNAPIVGLRTQLQEMAAAAKVVRQQPPPPVIRVRTQPVVAKAPRPSVPQSSSADAALGRVHRAFLTVLANRQGKTTRRNQLAVFSGYSAKSRHVDNTISALRVSGYVTGSSDALAITSDGLSAVGNYDELPTGRALIDYWIREAGKAPGEMLRALVDVYPDTLTRDEVAERANYSPTSRHVDNSLSTLRTLELVTGERSALKASDELFEAP